ncbi:MAG: UvrD-helicase domain-containing protein [Desulfobacterales bacterium]
MYFIADLHIHSRFSRATAKTLNFENLYIAAREKGITVVGTGDFTHPGWFEEIQDRLVPAEPGLFKLRDDLEAACENQVMVKDRFPVRFMLSCEISNIYKKNGVTRKTHNLIFLPDLTGAARFNSRLEQIGNIRSDGRPILGLDSRDLLEILLETSDEGFLIPAHIWTPWFSMFGSKSGFDTVRECFEDLTPHIHAVETGLSSDPPMNWRVGNIDGLTLVSNSDAHSPANLGREANLFNTELSYPAIKAAIETGDQEAFGGTIEFFPQEGKYHQDGHRKCNINLHPKEAIALNGICPVCGHPLTLGVLHRVEALATRPEGEKPEKTHPYYSVIPLAEILSEIVGTGPKSKKVLSYYQAVLEALGPELAVLHTLPVDAVDEAGIPLLTEGIRRMRAGSVHIFPGFDGQYGEIKVFTPEERDRLIGQQALFQVPKAPPKKTNTGRTPGKKKTEKNEPADAALNEPAAAEVPENAADTDFLAGLNPEQMQAVNHGTGPLMIVAGPGTGKTRTITCRIARLIQTETARPDQILAVTFTNKAAAEMSQRLAGFLGKDAKQPLAATFHAFCHRFLKETGISGEFSIIDDYDRLQLVREAMAQVKQTDADIKGRAIAVSDQIVCAKQQILSPWDDLSAAAGILDADQLARIYQAYQDLLATQQVCDYEDLIFKTVGILESDRTVRETYQQRFPYVFVDEYQDLNQGQYRIISALTRADGNICVIGDPDQSIYGFRGSDVKFFTRFTTDFPRAAQIRLTRNYRSAETILEASHQVIQNHSLNDQTGRLTSGICGPETIRLFNAASEKAEAVFIGKTIEQMVGGTGFDFDDFGGHEARRHDDYNAFSDFAVLFRTRAQGDIIAETLTQAGIPVQIATKENLFRRKGIQELMACLKLLEGLATYTDFDQTAGVLAPDLTAEAIKAVKNWGYANHLTLNGLLTEAERIPVPELTAASQDRLNAFFTRLAACARESAGLTVSQKLQYLEDKPGFQSLCRVDAHAKEAFSRLLAAASQFGDDTAAFIESAALQTDPDSHDSRSQKVSLLTLHAAKGLEFPVVFIAGCEDGYIPLRHAGGHVSEPAEERRLFYVAMTRAKTMLVLSRAKNRRIYGKKEERRPSPFLTDIDARLLQVEESTAKPKPAIQKQLNLF